MNTRWIAAASAAALLALTPAAFAQTDGMPPGNGMTEPDAAARPAVPSSAPSASRTSANVRVQHRMLDLPAELRQRVEPRMGPNQRLDELIETTLLNQLGRLGFARLEALHRDGENFVADVVTAQGQPASYRIETATGMMTQIR